EKRDDEESLALLLADVVNGADVGMIQSGRGLGFAAKALERLTVLGEIFGEKLEGDEAVEARVFRFVNHTHAAATEFLDDPVMRDGLIDQGKVRPSGRAMLRRRGREVKIASCFRGAA